MALENQVSSVSEDKRTGYTFEGKEVVLSKAGGRPQTGKKIWGLTDSKRIEVATLYACLGDVEKVAELAKVEISEVKQARRQPWFQDLLEQIRSENDEKIDAKFTQIVEKSLELVMDRLENGDFVLGRDGQLMRKPVGIKDLSIATAINIDKRQLLRGKPTSRTETVSSEDQLKVLAAQFTKLAGNKVPTDITDVEYIQVEDTNAQSTGTKTEEGSKEGRIVGQTS